MKAVLKIGGSIFEPSNFNLLASKITEWSKEHQLCVVIGGGKLSRDYGSMGRNFTQNEDRLDLIGISAARLNASLLIAALGEKACIEIPRSEEEFLRLVKTYPGEIIVAGGFRPGQRTDAVAVEIANAWKADIVIKATDVDYAYDKDPNEFEDAKPIEKMTFEELTKLADQEHKANKPTIMDKIAAELLTQNKIKVAVVNGKDLGNVENVLSGKDFKGTKIGF